MSMNKWMDGGLDGWMEGVAKEKQWSVCWKDK